MKRVWLTPPAQATAESHLGSKSRSSWGNKAEQKANKWQCALRQILQRDLTPCHQHRDDGRSDRNAVQNRNVEIEKKSDSPFGTKYFTFYKRCWWLGPQHPFHASFLEKFVYCSANTSSIKALKDSAETFDYVHHKKGGLFHKLRTLSLFQMAWNLKQFSKGAVMTCFLQGNCPQLCSDKVLSTRWLNLVIAIY